MRRRLIGRRRPDRAQGIELYWANRAARAKTPKAHAEVEWDRLKVEASKLPPGESTALWRDVASLLASRRKQVVTTADGDVHA